MDLNVNKPDIVKFSSGAFFVLSKVTHVTKDKTSEEFPWKIYFDNRDSISVNDAAYNTLLNYFNEIQ